MNTNSLFYFLEIAETGSLNKAAKNLYISQPALRASLSNLERELGGPLLERTKYGSFLTDLGVKVAAEAPDILNRIEEWKIYAKKAGKSEEISLYSTKPFCSMILMPVTALLQRQSPILTFSVTSANYSVSLQMLKKDNCQLAVIHTDLIDIDALRKELKLNDSYVVEKVLENHFLALINKNCSLNKKKSLSSTDFSELTYAGISTLEMFTTKTFLQTGFQSSHQPLYCDSHHSMYSIVNENKNYYSLLSNIFAMTDSYRIYQNVCFKPVIDLPDKTAFYLIHPMLNATSNLHKVCNAIKDYCATLTQTDSL